VTRRHYHCEQNLRTSFVINPASVLIRDTAPNAIHFTAPLQFGGVEDRWTPEDLLLSAVASCYTTTFRELAERSRFEYSDLEVEVQGSIQRADSGYQFSEIVMRPNLTILSEEGRERALVLLQKADALCLVSRALAHDGAGSGVTNSDLASAITVNVSSAATFNIDSEDVDMSNLPFTPVFDGSTIFKGQRILAVSSSGMMSGGGMGGMMGGGTVNASTINLEQQGLRGTVSAYSTSGSQATFTLTVASDSVFATLTGSTTLWLFSSQGQNCSACQPLATAVQCECAD
jgi:organic hydroperoxide reductase OsmC/OhrA